MKNMKKILCLFLTVLLLVSFPACSEESETTADDEIVYDYQLKTEEYEYTDEVTNYVVIAVDYTTNGGVHHKGDILCELYPDIAPITVENFQNLVKEKFYDGLIFHRVIEDFMIQGGDPLGNGTGGSETTIKGEFSANGWTNNLKHTKGVLSMARSSAYDSASSQFFIMHAESYPSLDGNYAAFGKVISGMTSVNKIAAVNTDSNDKPLNQVTITSIRFVKPIETETTEEETSI